MLIKRYLGGLKSNVKPEIIAVIGAGSGCGSTHFSISLANYLNGTTGCKTSILEMAEHKEFSKMRYMCDIDSIDENSFLYYGVDYYSNVTEERLSSIYCEDYRYIVIDCGNCDTQISNSIMLSNCKIVIGSLMPWKCYDYKMFCQRNRKYINNKTWKFYMFGGDQSDTVYFKKEFGIKINKLPVIPNPYKIRKEEMKFFDCERRVIWCL